MTDTSATGKTPTTSIRMPVPMRDAFHGLCSRLGVTATERIITAIRGDILANGTESEQRLLDQADAELAQRRARMHPGRPRKQEAD